MKNINSLKNLLLIAAILCASTSIFAQKQDDIIKSKKILSALEKQYWKAKQKNLREREIIEDNINNLSDQITTAYDKKSGLTEELYLLKENLQKIKQQYELAEQGSQDFKNTINTTIDTEAKRLQGAFPYLLRLLPPSLLLLLSSSLVELGAGTG